MHHMQHEHECICQGDGCNQNWATAGENGDTTTETSGGKKVKKTLTFLMVN